MKTTTGRHALNPAPSPDADDAPSLVARLPEIIIRTAWRERFRLSPLYLASCAALGVTTGTGLPTAAGLAVSAAAAEATSRMSPEALGLTKRERRVAAIGLGATAAWTGAMTAIPGLPWYLDAGLLVGSVAYPAHQWLTGRREPQAEAPAPSPYSHMAQQVLAGWVGEISVGAGPRALRASIPLPESIEEPAPGALVMNVRLARDVHAAAAVGEGTRRSLERFYGLPVDTLKLETVRDDSSLVRVIMTPERHLEVSGGLDWPGPVLLEDGSVPIAETADGRTIAIPLFAEDGIRHGMITGTTRVGKSVTSVSVMTPGIANGVEVVLYIDGKRGTSTPYLRPLVGRYARLEQQWPILVEIAHRIMVARQDRRGALGLHEFNTLTEDDPVITLFIDETSAVNRSAHFKAKHVRYVREILEQGGALGVRVVMVSQSPAGEDLIGGVQARGLMAGGWSINHRAGGKGASRLTLDSTDAQVSLLGLPNGGAAITVGGQLVGFPAQVRNATKDRVLEEIEAIQARPLSGADLAAAGPDWHAEHWEGCWTPGYTWQDPSPSGASARPTIGIPAQGTSKPAASHEPSHLSQQEIEDVITTWIFRALTEQGPLPLAALGRAIGVAPEGLIKVLDGLIRAELVMQTNGAYTLAPTNTGSAEAVQILNRQDQIANFASVLAAGGPVTRPAGDDSEDLPASRVWVMEQLSREPGGLTLGQLQDLDGAPARRTITNSLSDLMGRGAVGKDGALWTLTQPLEAVDDLSDETSDQ